MSKPIAITDTGFEREVIQADRPVLVDFGAAWCPPCRMVEPVIKEIAAEWADRLKVVTVDVDEAVVTTARYGVSGMPTIILYKDGQPIERIHGFQPKERLMSRLAPHLS